MKVRYALISHNADLSASENKSMRNIPKVIEMIDAKVADYKKHSADEDFVGERIDIEDKRFILHVGFYKGQYETSFIYNGASNGIKVQKYIMKEFANHSEIAEYLSNEVYPVIKGM